MSIVKTLSKCVREYKIYAILNPLFMIGEVACECIIPLFIAKLLEDAIQTGNQQNLISYSLIIVGLALLSFGFGFMGGKFAAIASVGFAKNVRHDLFQKINDFSFSNIDKFSSSSLVTRMTTDVGYLQMAFQMLIRITFRVPVMMIFSIVMAFLINPYLSWIFVIILPLMGIVFAIIVYYSYKLFPVLFKKYDKLNESVLENIKGIRVVKNFVREDYEKEKFANSSDALTKQFTKAERIAAMVNPTMILFMNIAFISVAVLGSFIIVYTTQGNTAFGTLNVPDLQALTTYGIQILSSVMMVSMIVMILSMSVASAKRVCEILVEDSTIKNPEQPIYEVINGDIEFENVSFKYAKEAEKFALKDINLKIQSGMTIGILGGTGASKTTLVNLISRLYDVSEGCVKVGGEDVKNYDLKTLRDNVAVVLQKNVLFSGTILENLRWGNETATLEEAIEACKCAQAHDFITTFPKGYDTFIEQGGSNVSGGQKQRLCIARALLKKPKVLILDDSTSAVDSKTDAMIKDSFARNIPDVTKIIISQRISSLEESDLIIVMENGEINGMGTNEELLANNAIYKEIFLIQTNVGGTK